MIEKISPSIQFLERRNYLLMMSMVQLFQKCEENKKKLYFSFFLFFTLKPSFIVPFFCFKTGCCFPLLLLRPPGALLLCQDLPVQEDSEEARDERGGAGEKAN